MTKTGTLRVSQNDMEVARCLGKEKVCKASDMWYGRRIYKKKYSPYTTFSTQVRAEFVKTYGRIGYPAFVCAFVKEHPQVRLVVYATNTRRLNAILDYKKAVEQ